MIKKAIERNSDCKEMSSVYRVVSLKGCNITSNTNENSKIIGHLSQGKHVLISIRSGRWMRIISPYIGWTPLYQTLSPLPKINDVTAAVRAAALAQPERHQRLVNTQENMMNHTPKAALEVILHPVSELQFNHFGGERLHGE